MIVLHLKQYPKKSWQIVKLGATSASMALVHSSFTIVLTISCCSKDTLLSSQHLIRADAKLKSIIRRITSRAVIRLNPSSFFSLCCAACPALAFWQITILGYTLGKPSLEEEKIYFVKQFTKGPLTRLLRGHFLP